MNYSSEYVSNDYIHLNHCGVQYLWDEDRSMERPNGRMDYHILYIHQGKCYTELFGKDVVVSEGNMILFKPSEKQKYSFYKSDKSISCYIHFTGTGCERILNSIGFDKLRVINTGKSKTLLALFEKMEMEASLGYPFSETLCASYICEILSLAGRKHSYSTNKLFLKNKSRIDIACEYIYEHHAENISIQSCAEQCNLSESRFSHIFKETIGKTPLEYITQIRVTKAKELLTTTNNSISEIAESTGFSNQNYFARIFRQYTGLSPLNYKKNNP